MSPDGPPIVPPEERLLKLIRGKERTPSPAQGAAAPRRLAQRAQRRPRLPRRWLGALNIGLGCLILGELMAFLWFARQPGPTMAPPLSPPAVSHPSPDPTGPAAVEPFAGLPSLAGVATRALFVDTTQGGASPTSRTTSSEAKTLAARLSLIGVVAGNPAQAIIEDAQTKKTYFVTTGETLIEGLMVEEISEYQVILDLHGEKIRLSL